MTESQSLSAIRIWAALAWADDKIVEEEAAALRRLIERAPMLSEEEREIAFGFLSGPVELMTENLMRLSSELRAGIYKSAVQLAAIDQEVAPAERAFLSRLQKGLALDQATVTCVETGVLGPRQA